MRWGVTDGFADAPLVMSELVTNAVRHAGSEMVVTATLQPDRLRLEVSDLSADLPVMGELAAARDGGWGLHIVEHLATTWGLETSAGGKSVWCEVPMAQAGSQP